MEYNKLCNELLNVARKTTDEETRILLLEILSDIEKNGIEDE